MTFFFKKVDSTKKIAVNRLFGYIKPLISCGWQRWQQFTIEKKKNTSNLVTKWLRHTVKNSEF